MWMGLLAKVAQLVLPARPRAFLRTAVYARSIRIAYLLHTKRKINSTITMPGFPGRFVLRTGTTDAMYFRMLVNGYDLPEYRLPSACRPGVILDLGANIGFVSILYAKAFPDAKIFAFEPMPENFKLLEQNVAAFKNVTPIPFGLGSKTQTVNYFYSVQRWNNSGGFYTDGSLSWTEHGPHAAVRPLPVLAVSEALDRYGITKADVIKIDTEGAEYDILSNMPDDFLDGVSVIVGEFHGIENDRLKELLERRFEVKWTQTHERSSVPEGGIGIFQAIASDERILTEKEAWKGDLNLQEPSNEGALDRPSANLAL